MFEQTTDFHIRVSLAIQRKRSRNKTIQ